MKRLLALSAILVGVLLVLVVLAPASWMDYMLQQLSKGSVGLGNPRGTVWRGAGSLQAISAQGGAVTLSPISWQIAVGELLSGRLHLIVISDQDGKALLDASLTPAGVMLREARLDAPAALLAVLSPTLRDADPSGTLSVQAKDFSVDGKHNSGSVEIDWNDAALSLSRVRPLGNYHMMVLGKGDALDLFLTTRKGDLTLDGRGLWKLGQKPDIDIKATPSAARRQDLEPMLRIIGHETTPGTYQLKLDQNVSTVAGR